MRPRHALALGNLFSVAHFYLIIYIVAPYLAQYMPASQTGLVVSLGAVITLLAFPLMPRYVTEFGARRLALLLGIIEMAALFILALTPTLLVVVAVVAIALATSPLIAYQLDLLLEAASGTDERDTGAIRGAFLTAGNVALIAAPLILGIFLDGTNNYSRIFLIAALSLLPFLLLFVLKKLPEHHKPLVSGVKNTCVCIMNDADLRAIAIANVVLQFFYHLAPLYIPLYLHNVLGLEWSTLGWMFAVMLLPFVLLEYPAGYLADRYFGDRVLLIAGFVIMGGAFALLALVTVTTPLVVILFILVLSRVGAALSEAMIEGHFFRRVTEDDANTVSVFRMMRPAASLAAPIVGSLILLLSTYSILFAVTGFLIIGIGVVSALFIRDMRRKRTHVPPAEVLVYEASA